MKKIGLISDTHGFVDPAVYTHFKDVDEIWHAGDFGPDVIQQLRNFKPLRGVYGNIDGKDVRSEFPEVLRFTCEGVEVLMIHIGGYPGKYSPLAQREIYTKPPKLFISGHSHILKVQFDEKFQCLHVNPGAAGKSGWHRVQTLTRFSITDEKIHNFEVIELNKR